jgi:putative transposase
MRNHTFATAEYYHVYNRGVEKRLIFQDALDKNRFQYLLFICNTSEHIEVRNFFNNKKMSSKTDIYSYQKKDRLVDIGAYVLMPNHFHILIKEVTSGGISKFMQKVQTGYTMYFNQRNNRTGGLFQGTLKSQHVDSDVYLKYLFCYIHLNPLKLKDPLWATNKQLIENQYTILQTNSFSSYLDYTTNTQRSEKVILSPESYPKYFLSYFEHKNYIKDWFKIKAQFC